MVTSSFLPRQSSLWRQKLEQNFRYSDIAASMWIDWSRKVKTVARIPLKRLLLTGLFIRLLVAAVVLNRACCFKIGKILISLGSNNLSILHMLPPTTLYFWWSLTAVFCVFLRLLVRCSRGFQSEQGKSWRPWRPDGWPPSRRASQSWQSWSWSTPERTHKC